MPPAPSVNGLTLEMVSLTADDTVVPFGSESTLPGPGVLTVQSEARVVLRGGVVAAFAVTDEDSVTVESDNGRLLVDLESSTVECAGGLPKSAFETLF